MNRNRRIERMVNATLRRVNREFRDAGVDEESILSGKELYRQVIRAEFEKLSNEQLASIPDGAVDMLAANISFDEGTVNSLKKLAGIMSNKKSNESDSTDFGIN
jgi:hypothetical protein